MTLQNETKYLYYKTWPKPEDTGLDHWIDILEDFICIALNVHRVPVIPTVRRNALNKSQDSLNFQLEDYLDLTNTKIYKVEANGIIKQQATHLHWISEADADLKLSKQASMQYVNIDQLYKNDNSKYKFISLINNKKNYTPPKPYHYVKTIPSKKVHCLTDAVLKNFKTNRQILLDTQDLLYKSSKTDYFIREEPNLVSYACLNLYNTRFSIFANRPSKIISLIGHIFRWGIGLAPSFRNIYLISNNRSLRFSKTYNCGLNRLKIHTYHDFPELNAISENDYLLYSVEKNLFSYAVVKIYPSNANKAFYAAKSKPFFYSALRQHPA